MWVRLSFYGDFTGILCCIALRAKARVLRVLPVSPVLPRVLQGELGRGNSRQV